MSFWLFLSALMAFPRLTLACDITRSTSFSSTPVSSTSSSSDSSWIGATTYKIIFNGELINIHPCSSFSWHKSTWVKINKYLLEKVTAAQLTKKFPAFYRIQRLPTVFTEPYPQLGEMRPIHHTLYLQCPLPYYFSTLTKTRMASLQVFWLKFCIHSWLYVTCAFHAAFLGMTTLIFCDYKPACIMHQLSLLCHLEQHFQTDILWQEITQNVRDTLCPIICW